ncbi:hypothetical protein F5887DRAFT_1157636 [Amanita rubescens]|nr:hypothetical protein F5887DRAFT_1157636 [Amanita rubescens]
MPDVPVEILDKIFKQSLSSPLQASQPWKFPWYLGHVCSQWRALFFSMRSTFWSKIKIEILIEDFWGHFTYKSFYGVHSILMRLIEYSAQWEEVSVQLKTLVVFLQSTKGRLPLLKKLEITEATYYQFMGSQMTVIHFHHTMHPERILAALRGTINLVELTAERYQDTGGDISIHLPHLECLSVSGVGLLTVLETPALRRLKVAYNGLDDAGITLSFLRRSKIKLSTLVVKDARATTVKEILPSVPEVNDLGLLCVQDVANVFKWLAETGERDFQINTLSVICHDFIIIKPNPVEEGLPALHDMIARQNPLDDARNPSPKEVIIQKPLKGQSVAANLKSMCRSRGIRFGFAEEMPTLTWGIE